MNFPKFCLLLCVCLQLTSCDAEKSSSASVNPSIDKLPIGEGFDFYVLALSWSPGYCASEGQSANKRQCEGERRYEFVVHGLWPQFEKGYPQNCESTFGDTIENSLINSMLDVMPSYGLIKHQWRKHGTCSGLSPSDFFAVTRMAYEKVSYPPSFRGLQSIMTVSPDSVERLFQAENEAIPSDRIAVTCKRNYLRDVRICLTKDLSEFRACPEVDRNHCKSQSVAVAPTR